MDNVEIIGCFKAILDPYNGITIEIESLPNTKEEFEDNLNLLINTQNSKRNLIWIYIDISKSDFIPIATKNGFFFHSCDEDYILVVKRLKENAIVPTAANHTLGVGAVVINEKNELLVIKERMYSKVFKLPGGHIDNKEMISKACIREVLEETGVQVEFKSVISISHLYPHQFHKSNLYIACLAKPTTLEINIQDIQEIEEAKWIDVYEYLESENAPEFSKNIVNAALNTEGFKIEKPEFLKNFSRNLELFLLQKNRV